MSSAIFFPIVIAVIVITLLLVVKLYISQRRSRFTRIFLDGLGMLVILPTIVIVIAILDIEPAGANMTGFAAFMIYSVMSLGAVPLLTLCMLILSVRVVLRIFKKRIFR